MDKGKAQSRYRSLAAAVCAAALMAGVLSSLTNIAHGQPNRRGYGGELEWEHGSAQPMMAHVFAGLDDVRSTGTTAATANAIAGLTEAETYLVDDNATAYGTFQSHNNKVVSNQNGIFMTHIRTRNDAYTAQQWRLSRSTDGGKTFSTIFEATDATSAPALETDAAGNIYLVRPDFVDSNAYLYRFQAGENYAAPVKSTIPGGSGGKYAMAYDAAQARLYYSNWGSRFYSLDLAGNIIRDIPLTSSGANAGPQYPLLNLAPSGMLHMAFTTLKHSEYLYWDIHHMQTPDGGATWKNMDGTLLSPPVVIDDTGPTDRITLDDEFTAHTWCSSVMEKDGKLHFLYLAQAPVNRQHYMRYDASTGQREIDIQPVFAGKNISLSSLDGYFAKKDSLANGPLYCISNAGGRIGCLASDDNGATWYDYAVSNATFNPYSIGGGRSITADGYIIGAFTDQQTVAQVHFIRIKAGLSKAVVLNSSYNAGNISAEFSDIRGQPERIRFSADKTAWSNWTAFSANLTAPVPAEPWFYQLQSRMGVDSDVFEINPAATKPGLAVSASASPSTVTPGGQATLTVTVTSNGTGVAGAFLAFSDGAKGGSFSAASDLGGGIYRANYTAPTNATNITIALKANATKPGYIPAEGSAEITVAANIIRSLTVSISCSATAVYSGGSILLAMNVTDSGTGAGVGGAFLEMDDGGAGGAFTAVVDSGNGSYASQYTSPHVSSPIAVTITAIASVPGFTGGQGIARVDVAPGTMIVSVTPSRPIVSSGDSMAVTVAICDQQSAPLPGASVTLGDGGAGGAFSTVNDNGDGTYTSLYTTPIVSADTQVSISCSAALAGYADATATASVTVSPMTGATLKGAVAATPSSLQSGELSTVTVTVTADSVLVVGAQVSLDCGGKGSIFPATGATDAAGTFVANYTAPNATAQTTVKITASFQKGGYVSGTASANITIYPAMPDLSIDSSAIVVKKVSHGSYAVNITVKNLGQASAADAPYRIYLDEILQGGDRAISVPGHGQAGASITLSGVVDGEHTVSVRLDPDGQIPESSEANNEASAQFTAVAGGGGGDAPPNSPSMFYVPVAVTAVILIIVIAMLLAIGKRKKKNQGERPVFAQYSPPQQFPQRGNPPQGG